MGTNINNRVAGVGSGWYRIILGHVSTTVTILEDNGGFLTSAAHSSAGIMDLLWKASRVGDATPGFSGITCPSNIVGQVISPIAAGCSINTKLVNTGGNFNSARTEFYVKREAL